MAHCEIHLVYGHTVHLCQVPLCYFWYTIEISCGSLLSIFFFWFPRSRICLRWWKGVALPSSLPSLLLCSSFLIWCSLGEYMLAESSGSVSSFTVNCFPQHALAGKRVWLYFAGLFQLAFVRSPVWIISHVLLLIWQLSCIVGHHMFALSGESS